MNQPWSSLEVPRDAIIGVLNAVFQRWPDPGTHEGHHSGQPDTIYRCAASRKKYGRPRQSHVEAQCMQLQMDQITQRLLEGRERLLSAEAADRAAKLNGESRASRGTVGDRTQCAA